MRERFRRIEEPVKKAMKDGSEYFGRGVWGPSESDRKLFNSLHDFKNDEGGGAKVFTGAIAGTVAAATVAVWFGQPIVEAVTHLRPAAEVRSATGPTPAPTEIVTPSPSPSVRINQAPTPTPFNGCPVIETETANVKQIDNIKFSGFPDSTGNLLNADTATAANGVTFSHKIKGVGTEKYYAEPGGLLVGNDFESTHTGNPNGDNPQGWAAEWNSDGHINQFDAETHAILRGCPETQLVPTGGMVEIVGNKFTVEIYHTDENGNLVFDNMRVDVGEVHGGINMLTIRGLFADMTSQNHDNNRLAVISGYVPGTVEVKMYKPGKKSNTAFISEGQFLQVVRDAHEGQTNCGTGCSDFEWAGIDLNTKGLDVAKQTAGQDADFTQGWQKRGNNN